MHKKYKLMYIDFVTSVRWKSIWCLVIFRHIRKSRMGLRLILVGRFGEKQSNLATPRLWLELLLRVIVRVRCGGRRSS